MGKDLKGKELGSGISQRKDGRYMYRYKDHYGKAHCEYFEKYVDAKRKQTDIEYEKKHSIFKPDTTITLNKWFDFWINEIKRGKVKPKTVKNYRYIYNAHIKNQIGFLMMHEITPELCIRRINEMYDLGYATSTMGHVRKLIKLLYDDANENGRNLKNPITKSVKTIKYGEKKRKALTAQEQEDFLQEARSSVYYRMFIVAFETGLRAGELGAIRPSDITEDCISVVRKLDEPSNGVKSYFSEPKTENSIRYVPLTERAKNAINSQLAITQNIPGKAPELDDLIFKTRNGGPIYSGRLDKAMDYIVKRINTKRKAEAEAKGERYREFPHMHIHMARHTFATRCAEKGMKPKVLQEIMGHASIEITMRYYVHVNKEEMKREIQRLNTPEMKEEAYLKNQKILSFSDFSKKGCVKSVSNQKIRPCNR